jgi:hypothetical protein
MNNRLSPVAPRRPRSRVLRAARAQARRRSRRTVSVPVPARPSRQPWPAGRAAPPAVPAARPVTAGAAHPATPPSGSGKGGAGIGLPRACQRMPGPGGPLPPAGPGSWPAHGQPPPAARKKQRSPAVITARAPAGSGRDGSPRIASARPLENCHSAAASSPAIRTTSSASSPFPVTSSRPSPRGRTAQPSPGIPPAPLPPGQTRSADLPARRRAPGRDARRPAAPPLWPRRTPG